MNAVKSLIAGAALAVTMTGAALAAGVELNASSTGLALQGYDPVAYFTNNAPTKGSWKITTVYNDATYRFANEDHKAAFEADPEAYLPQYGGYCAFGAAMGFKFDGDPTYWRIEDGELYLNISADIQERWLTDIPGFVSQADANWIEIEHTAPEDLQ